MPTYENNTAAAITYNGTTWEPSDEHAVNFFVPDEKGLDKTDDDPVVAPTTLDSGILSLSFGDAAERIYIPDCEYALVSIILKSGAVTVQENYDDNPVMTPVDTASAYRAVFKRVDVESVYITAVLDTILSYSISRAR
jgi:hypothetical protein